MLSWGTAPLVEQYGWLLSCREVPAYLKLLERARRRGVEPQVCGGSKEGAGQREEEELGIARAVAARQTAGQSAPTTLCCLGREHCSRAQAGPQLRVPTSRCRCCWWTALACCTRAAWAARATWGCWQVGHARMRGPFQLVVLCLVYIVSGLLVLVPFSHRIALCSP